MIYGGYNQTTRRWVVKYNECASYNVVINDPCVFGVFVYTIYIYILYIYINIYQRKGFEVVNQVIKKLTNHVIL